MPSVWTTPWLWHPCPHRTSKKDLKQNCSMRNLISVLCTVTIRERHQLTISLKVGRKATAFVKELTFNDRREAAWTLKGCSKWAQVYKLYLFWPLCYISYWPHELKEYKLKKKKKKSQSPAPSTSSSFSSSSSTHCLRLAQGYISRYKHDKPGTSCGSVALWVM